MIYKEPVQKSVTFAQALAAFRPTGCKTAFFNGCCYKTEVLQQPQYRKLDEYTKKMIINNSLFFSNPLDYNDPYDTIINFYFEGEYNFLYNKFEKMGLKNLGEFAKKLCRHNEFTGIYKNYPDLLTLSISCFSEVCDDILLWSHYADGHKGLCLEYKIIENNNDICLLFDGDDMKIDYPVQLLKVNYVEKQLGKVNALYTKHFTGIIFGLNFNENEKESFKEFVRKHHKNIKFYSSVECPNEYKIKIK